jgi:RNA polymerase sigma factor (sigma-70 family)
VASSPRSITGFPSTRRSIVAAVRTDDPAGRRAAYDTLVAVYWRPVYSRLRLRWGAEPADAEDLTQEFFVRAMERDFFGDFDPARARFRTYLRLCLDRFTANAHRAERRLKRGGGATVLPLDSAGLERDLARAAAAGEAPDADAWFDREWVRGLFGAAVDALRKETAGTPREIRFRVFTRHDLEPSGDGERPSYRELAADLGLSVSQVTNHLAWARRELRRLVLERLEVLSGSDAEVREEAAAIFGRGG